MTASACCGNQLAAEASAGAWRFSERIAVAGGFEAASTIAVVARKRT